MALLEHTVSPDEVDAADYDAIYFTGGHAVMFDFPESEGLQRLTREIYEKGGVIGAVCHGYCGLRDTKLSDGSYLVAGRNITGFSWREEVLARVDKLVPYNIEDEMKQGGFDLKGSWGAVTAVSGLFALIIFSTFNNFIGGVYMALMDPYGLELFSVEIWGLVFALGGTGFIIGGALIGKFGLGENPLRTLLLAVMAMGLVGAVFTLREWAWLYILGIWLYMVLVPAVEAAEQTVIQRVVPLEKQGRVFGFAGAFEASAAPLTAFLIAPIAELWIIPWSRSAEGAAALAPWLGTGTSRGIALVFLAAGLIMVLAALIAFFGPVYRRVSADYAEAARRDAEQERILKDSEPAPVDPLS